MLYCRTLFYSSRSNCKYTAGGNSVCFIWTRTLFVQNEHGSYLSIVLSPDRNIRSVVVNILVDFRRLRTNLGMPLLRLHRSKTMVGATGEFCGWFSMFWQVWMVFFFAVLHSVLYMLKSDEYHPFGCRLVVVLCYLVTVAAVGICQWKNPNSVETQSDVCWMADVDWTELDVGPCLVVSSSP